MPRKYYTVKCLACDFKPEEIYAKTLIGVARQLRREGWVGDKNGMVCPRCVATAEAEKAERDRLAKLPEPTPAGWNLLNRIAKHDGELLGSQLFGSEFTTARKLLAQGHILCRVGTQYHTYIDGRGWEKLSIPKAEDTSDGK